MDSIDVTIARLVLGYLKREHCRKAYDEFLRTSGPLGEHSSNRSNKYISTRFIGLTLEEILSEYFEISQIVQGRLEPTDYYNEGHSRTSLVQQLLYLLNKVQLSRTSTPCPRSPSDSNLGETSPSYIEHISDVEATPAHTLPGNIQYESKESYTNKSSRRKTQSKYAKMGTTNRSPLMEKEDVSEILAQTLLENREFHEKIAQTINKVAEKQFKSSAELDKTIKTVVKETEEDPIFDRILEDIIGSSNHLDDDENKALETGSTTSSNAHKTNRRSLEAAVDNENAYQPSVSNSVDQQTADAIQSIVDSSQVNTNAQKVDEQGKNEVVVFDGSLDKYLQSDNAGVNVAQTQAVQNPLYINTTTAFFIPNNVTGYSNPDIKKQVVVLNNQQPTINWTTPGIMTENDILTMPTVILSDSGLKKSDLVAIPNNDIAPVNKRKVLLPKIPKQRIEISADLSEYLKLNNTEDVKLKTGLKKVHYPKSTNTATSSSSSADIITAKAISPERSKLENSKDNTQSDEQREIGRVQTSGRSMPTTCTPPPVQPIRRTTPKSGSHIRNLDFSSPPKITSTHKKSSTSKPESKSPQFVHKKQAAKLLFKDTRTWDADLRAVCEQADRETSCSKPKEKRNTSFGTRKRTSNKETLKPKQKKLLSTKKTKKKVENSELLNTTEQNAALVEAALQTPEKQEVCDEKLAEEAEKSTKSADIKCKEKLSEIIAVSNSKSDQIKPDNANTKSDNNENKEKFETPETMRESTAQSVNANRNIMSLLETPMKDQVIPKTPGLTTPSDMNLSSLNFTPFTKMLEDNLKGIDIGSIPTPSIPITPNFPPFTPMVDLTSPFSNRPTDYSTSSSYYQPSDNEQNRSLEAQLREVEKNPTPVDQVKSMFNKNVIGKKNLNLMKREVSESPDSSTSTSDSITEASDSHWCEKGSNDTVILKKKEAETPKRTYSLRNRSVSHETIKRDLKAVSRKNSADKKKLDSKIVNKLKNSDESIQTLASKPVEVKDMKSSLKIKKSPGDSCSTKTENKIVKRRLSTKKTIAKTSNKKKKLFEDEKQKPEKESKDESLSEEVSEEEIDVKAIIHESKNSLEKTRKSSKKIEVTKKIGKISDPPAESRVSGEKETQKNVLESCTKKTSKVIFEKGGKSVEDSKNSFQVSGKVSQCTEPQNQKESTPTQKSVEENNQFLAKSKNPRKALLDGQSSVSKELEEKRQRMISKLKDNCGTKKMATPPKKKQINGKFKIKPIPSLCVRKKPRKSDSPKKIVQIRKPKPIISSDSDSSTDIILETNKNESKSESSKTQENVTQSDKSTSDVEAQNLIEGMKERGIHLIHNKSPKKKIERDIKEGQIIDCSSSQIDTLVRETYDTKTFEGEDTHIIFDMENVMDTSNTNQMNQLPPKTFIGKVYLEGLGEEIDVPLKFSTFYTLLDIPSEENLSDTKKKCEQNESPKIIIRDVVIIKEKNVYESVLEEDKDDNSENMKKICPEIGTFTANDAIVKNLGGKSNCSLSTETPVDDDLMNFASTGKEDQDRSQSPRSTKKRKLSSGEGKYPDKKVKTLLKNINVDSFLNDIRGKPTYHLKK
ncbi:uncharacterized protein [Leptinotarsa decemlineata]|uniref:uncharacterized protein n=1 Tax=Leptinotarsa decemlineata TaxID=7539 RepID=UPI003D304401